MQPDNTAPVIEMLSASTLGGGELVGIGLAESLKDRGRTTAVWVPKKGAAFSESMSRGLKTRVVPYGRLRSSNLFLQLASLLQLEQSRRKQKRGIFHIHEPYLYQSASRLFSGRSRVIAHVHIENPPKVFRWCFRRPPSCIITCSKHLATRVRESLPESVAVNCNILAAPNAVDTGRFTPGDRADSRSLLNLPQGTCGVLMIANLAPHKGQVTAIRALRNLLDNGRDVECWIAGTERKPNGYLSDLKSLAKKLDLADRVRFLGHCDNPETLLNACDILVLPSTKEGLPLSILEAQATKRPVIASPTAGIPEVITHGTTGFLIAHDDYRGYAKMIESLIISPGLYDEISNNAYTQIQQHHTWDSYVDRIIGIYDSLE
ncbi:glycosyltransferase family 4 protein [Roseiconus lacunae]|uniref:glycosyltransferase family 4 protein n=1 Tax=Roseiconus lacunae TaxID=2605694 RepID=UPI00308BD7DA|nr:glycosyltransferase family 4 protein [Stieleria sp. HD01]